jgi:phytoene/squalene synthetase
MQELRPALFAIHALNVETALIPDQVSQPQLAQMRYQWWREAINSIKGAAPLRHPVVQALSQARHHTKLHRQAATIYTPKYTCQFVIEQLWQTMKNAL